LRGGRGREHPGERERVCGFSWPGGAGRRKERVHPKGRDGPFCRGNARDNPNPRK